MDQGNKAEDSNQTQTTDGDDKSPKKPVAGKPIAIQDAHDFDPFGDDGTEYPEDVHKVYDADPASFWQTSYYNSAKLGNLKPGVGVILDLGKAQRVGKVTVSFMGSTSVELRAASGGTGVMPTSLESYAKVAEGLGTTVTLKPGKSLNSQYLLVWLTELPIQADDGKWRGRVMDIKVTG
jgi:hypothetical protein